MDFKVGDRVKNKTFGIGTVVEINSGIVNDSILVQFDKENEALHSGSFCKGTYREHSCWHFRENKLYELELYKYTKQDLLDSPIGTKITTDKDKILVKDDIKNGHIFESTSHLLDINEINEDLTISGRGLGNKIVKIEVPTYSTVYEEKEAKEMTLKEIEEQLGYKIKIKGE